MHARHLLAVCLVVMMAFPLCSAKDSKTRDPKKDLLKKWSGMGDSPLLNPQTEDPIRLGALIEIKEEGSDVLPFLPPSADYNWIDKNALFREHTEPPDVIDRISKVEFNAQYAPFAKEINRGTVKALYQAQAQVHLKPGTMTVKMMGFENVVTECQKTQNSQLTKDYCKHVLGGKFYLVYATRLVDSMDYGLERNKAGGISFQAGVDAPECPKPTPRPPGSTGNDAEKPAPANQPAQSSASGSSAGFGVCVRDEYTLSVTTPHLFSVRVAHFDAKHRQMDGRRQFTITVP